MKIEREYTFFKLKKGGHISFHIPDEDRLHVESVKPPFQFNFHLIWRLSYVLGGDYRIYKLFRGEKIVCSAEIVTWIPQFGFMPFDGIQIGPCVTERDERGKGYYPYLLSQIIDKYPQKDFYMIIHETNIASVRGVQKLGFQRWARGGKNKLGLYVTKEIISESKNGNY